jgi:small basic protein
MCKLLVCVIRSDVYVSVYVCVCFVQMCTLVCFFFCARVKLVYECNVFVSTFYIMQLRASWLGKMIGVCVCMHACVCVIVFDLK